MCKMMNVTVNNHEEELFIIEDTKLVCNDWTNGYYKLEVYLNRLPDIVEKILYENEDSQLVYGEDNGFIRYGAIAKKASFGHQPGYRWSSRASVFNGMFGKTGLDDVTYIVDGCRYSGCMDANLVLEFLPKGFYIIEQVETDKNGKISEIMYHISNAEHEKEMSWYYGDTIYSNGARRYVRRRMTYLERRIEEIDKLWEERGSVDATSEPEWSEYENLIYLQGEIILDIR